MAPYGYAITLFVLGYLVSFTYFTDYLRRVHHGTYVDLGEPKLMTSSRSVEDQSKLLLALLNSWGFIFSSAHTQLEDFRLSMFVWWMRIVIAGSLLLFVGLFFRS